MKKELVLLAALALPIQAQQPTAPSQILTTMGKVAAPAAATPADRAKALPCLAKLPKDTGDFIVLTEAAAPMLQSIFAPDTPSTLPLSAAVASSGKNAPLYDAIGKIVVMSVISETMNQAAVRLVSAEGASPAAKEHLKKIATALDKDAAAVAKAIAGKKLHPVYIVTTFKEAPVDMPQPEDGMTLADVLQGVKTVVEAGATSHPGLDALMAEAAKHQFVVKSAMEGTTRTIYICEKGVEPKFAAKPEDSVLATPKLARADAGIGGKMLAAGYVSPELQTTLGKAYLQYCALNPHVLASILEVNEETRGMGANVVKSSAAAQRWIKAFIGPDAKKPGSFQVWTDKKQGAYHVSIDMDARGCSYTGELRQTKAADAKNTFLYIESTGFKRPQELPDIGSLLKPFAESLKLAYNTATSSAPAVAAAGDDEVVVDEEVDVAPDMVGGADPTGLTGMVDGFLPMVDDLSTIGKGLGDGFALIGDFAVKGKDKKTPFPRVGYACTITDMDQVSTGWGRLASHAGKLMGELKTTSKEGKDGETCHKLKLPTNEGDFVPNALTDGKRLAFGSSIKLDKALLAGMASKGVSFSGTVFMLNMDTLFKGLKATSSDPESIIPPMGDAIPSGGVKSVFGTSTISDGVHSIRLDIRMK